MSWAVYVETGIEKDEKDQVLSHGTVELRAGSYFVPCGEGPSMFRILKVFSTHEEARDYIKEGRYE